MTNKLQNVGKYIAPAVFLCVLGGLMWYQSHQHHGYYNSGYRSVMGTFAQVTVVAASEEQAHSFITAAFAEMDKVNRIMNDWDPNSEISQLTQTAYPEPKVVSPELFEVIAASVEYSKLSDGAFDNTVGPETQLWRQMQKTGQRPSPEALTAARAKVGYEKVTLNPAEKTVQFAVAGMKLDVGAIAKGYAVDIAMEAMRTQGAVAGMVDLGGNVRCFGPGPAGGNWYIGLRDPRHTEKTLIKLRLNEMAVATSGDYERYAVVDGQPQSHILNPKTSESVKELASVTIIAPTAMQADALSTAVSVLGKEKGLALIEKIPGVEAIVMTSAQPDQRIETPGAKQFIEMD